MDVPRNELKNAGSADYRSPMTFYRSRDEAVRVAGRDPDPARTAAFAHARSLSLATITRAPEQHHCSRARPA